MPGSGNEIAQAVIYFYLRLNIVIGQFLIRIINNGVSDRFLPVIQCLVCEIKIRRERYLHRVPWPELEFERKINVVLYTIIS